MSVRRLALLFPSLAFFLGLSYAPPALAEGTPPSPNLVFFIVDDMGWQDTSVPFHDQRTPFNGFFHTPSMERLASEGMTFTQAYASSVCTPTRVSFLTGQNPTRHHVTSWTLQGETSRSSPTLLPPRWKREGLQPEDGKTLPMLLRERGYHTIHIGKAHWGARNTAGSDPRNLGFDVNVAGHAAGAPESFQGLDRYGEGKPGKEEWAVPGLAEYKGNDIHLTDALTTEACRALDHAVKVEKKPFFLHLSHYAVHTPIQPHRPYQKRYEGKGVDATEVNYASMVEGMDASLGRILDHLRELGVAADTLVVFHSDNGGLSQHARGRNILGTNRDTHNLPLREGKGSPYEGGIRVPVLASWAAPDSSSPHQTALPIPAGARSSRPILIEDWFTTFLAIAGVKPPPDQPVDGRDLRDTLRNPSPAAPPADLFWHYPNLWIPYPKGGHSGYQPNSVIRSGDWKAIYFHDPARWELYNLGNDPGETNNLADSRPEILRDLAGKLITHLDNTHAPLPIERATGMPKRIAPPELEK